MANQMFTPMSDNEADALLDELFGSSEVVETETKTEPTVEAVAEMPVEPEAKAADVELEEVDELPETQAANRSTCSVFSSKTQERFGPLMPRKHYDPLVLYINKNIFYDE